jgi:hypothetical protein
VAGGAVTRGAVGTVAVLPTPVAGGTVAGVVAGAPVATGVPTEGVAPEPEGARPAKKSESPATSPTPPAASQRVVDEILRIPVSRSTDR